MGLNSSNKQMGDRGIRRYLSMDSAGVWRRELIAVWFGQRGQSQGEKALFAPPIEARVGDKMIGGSSVTACPSVVGRSS